MNVEGNKNWVHAKNYSTTDLRINLINGVKIAIKIKPDDFIKVIKITVLVVTMITRIRNNSDNNNGEGMSK